MSDTMSTSRLTMLQAAWVVARRDFLAILLGRNFLFFLLGPLFFMAITGIAGALGAKAAVEADEVHIGISMAAGENQKLVKAADFLRDDIGLYMPPIAVLEGLDQSKIEQALKEQKNIAVVITGSLDKPVLMGTKGQVKELGGRAKLLVARAVSKTQEKAQPITIKELKSSGAEDKKTRDLTSKAGQTLLFMLIMLLGGMVLSNLVEEKGNKIIEVLAAAIPMEAVFFGKLFAMLAISMVGISIWGSTGYLVVTLGGVSADFMAPPAVGWPMFMVLGTLYFAMAYLVLGSVFLTVGSMAATVRDVQMLNMPVTIGQMLIFFFAQYVASSPGSAMEIAACIVPFSSPFAMLARAAQDASLWPHLAALGWQALCVFLFVKIGAQIFRRRVMQSGPRGGSRKGIFARLRG